RDDERGDVIFRITLEEAQARHAALASIAVASNKKETEKDSAATPGALPIAQTSLRVAQITISPDGQRLAFVTESVSERQEKMEDIDLYLVNLANNAAEAPIRLTRNEALELSLEWSPDKKYEDPQPRLYWIEVDDTSTPPEKRNPQRWFADYPGEVVHYAPLPDGSAL